jgi:DNA-binding PadR family transcriptional regulator
MTSSEPRRSSLGMLVLWLLWNGPNHVYGLQKQIEDWGKDRVVNVRSRASLYQTLDRLVRLGLVKVAKTERREQRPERIVYDLTDDGRETARRWLKEALSSTGEEFPEFIAAVSILAGLEPEEVRVELARRAERRETELAETERAMKLVPGLPRLFLLEEEYRRTMLKAEIRWLRSVIADIERGDLTWSQKWLEQVEAEFAGG